MNNKGFTLVELIGVILLLGVLSTIGVLSVTTVIRNQRTKLEEQQFQELTSSIETYATDKKFYFKKCDATDYTQCEEYKIITISELIPDFFDNKKDVCNPNSQVAIYMNSDYDFVVQHLDPNVCTYK